MKVLLAVADEEFGAAITDFVTHHKWPAGTHFRVLHVMEWTPPERELLHSQTVSQYLEEARQAATRLTGQVAVKVQQELRDVLVEEVITEGSPVQRIIGNASGWQADMIVVGSHGRKGVSLFLLGSVSLGVVSNAPCSVVVIRLPQPARKGVEPAKQAGRAVLAQQS